MVPQAYKSYYFGVNFSVYLGVRDFMSFNVNSLLNLSGLDIKTEEQQQLNCAMNDYR